MFESHFILKKKLESMLLRLDLGLQIKYISKEHGFMVEEWVGIEETLLELGLRIQKRKYVRI